MWFSTSEADFSKFSEYIQFNAPRRTFAAVGCITFQTLIFQKKKKKENKAINVKNMKYYNGLRMDLETLKGPLCFL